jgi:hypothetical protein
VGAATQQIIVQDVDAVIDADAENQRERDHISGIERHAEQGENAQRKNDGQYQRRHGDGGALPTAEIDPQHGHDDEEGVDAGPLQAVLHRPQTLDGAERFAGGSGIDRMDLLRELLQLRKLPQRLAREDAQQPFAALADVAIAEGGRQIGQRDRLRRGHFAETMQVLGQIAGQPLLESLQAFPHHLHRHEENLPMQAPCALAEVGQQCRGFAVGAARRAGQRLEPHDQIVEAGQQALTAGRRMADDFAALGQIGQAPLDVGK